MNKANIRFTRITGVIAVFLLVLSLSGWADSDDKIKNSLRQGNKSYEAGLLEESLRFYETGLEAGPKNGALNFNAGQAAYLIGDYINADQYYEHAKDSVDKYLNHGNTLYRSGAALEEDEQKVKCYAQALGIYMDGIIKYPGDVSLKYNYEYVKALLDTLLEEMKQQNEGDSGSKEQDEGEPDEQSEGQSEGQSERSEDQGDSGDDTDNRETDEQDSQESQESLDDSRDEDEKDDPDMEAIARVLEALESREEESLKNNQSVIKGRADGNGW